MLQDFCQRMTTDFDGGRIEMELKKVAKIVYAGGKRLRARESERERETGRRDG